MNIFDNFPYSDLHELNLDWIIKKIKEMAEGKQDKLTAGENITIQDNVISATGGGSSPLVYTLQADSTFSTFTPYQTTSPVNSYTILTGESIITFFYQGTEAIFQPSYSDGMSGSIYGTISTPAGTRNLQVYYDSSDSSLHAVNLT